MSIPPPQDAAEWIQISEYDLETAQAMLETGRYLYVPFCCQQAIEKRLKAIIADETAVMPPKIHNLVRLAKLAGVDLPAEKGDLLEQLNTYYIEGRYADDVAKLMTQMAKKLAGRILRDTREFLSWLVQQKS